MNTVESEQMMIASMIAHGRHPSEFAITETMFASTEPIKAIRLMLEAEGAITGFELKKHKDCGFDPSERWAALVCPSSGIKRIANEWRKTVGASSILRGGLVKIGIEVPDDTIDMSVVQVAVREAVRASAAAEATMTETWDAALTLFEEPSVTPCGIPPIDEELGGLPNNYVLLAATPGAGKTLLGNWAALHYAKAGRPVLFVSLEMSPKDIAHRMIVIMAEITREEQVRMVADTLSVPARERIAENLTKAMRHADGLPIRIVRHPQSFSEIEAIWREMRADTGKNPVLIIDYMQRLAELEGTGGGTDERSRINQLSEQVKQFADIVESSDDPVPTIMLAQELATGDGGAPTILSERKVMGSGKPEQDATLLVFVSRENGAGTGGGDALSLGVKKSRKSGGVGDLNTKINQMLDGLGVSKDPPLQSVAVRQPVWMANAF